MVREFNLILTHNILFLLKTFRQTRVLTLSKDTPQIKIKRKQKITLIYCHVDLLPDPD